MRPTLAAFAAGFITLGVSFAAHADAVKVSPHLTVFTKEQTASNDGSPTILRGSATKRGTVYNGRSRYDELGPVQIGAESTLWLADPATGELFACEPRRTGSFDDRYEHCFDGEAPY